MLAPPVPLTIELTLPLATSRRQVALPIAEAGRVCPSQDAVHIIQTNGGLQEAVPVHRAVEDAVCPLAAPCTCVGPEYCSGE